MAPGFLWAAARSVLVANACRGTHDGPGRGRQAHHGCSEHFSRASSLCRRLSLSRDSQTRGFSSRFAICRRFTGSVAEPSRRRCRRARCRWQPQRRVSGHRRVSDQRVA